MSREFVLLIIFIFVGLVATLMFTISYQNKLLEIYHNTIENVKKAFVSKMNSVEVDTEDVEELVTSTGIYRIKELDENVKKMKTKTLDELLSVHKIGEEIVAEGTIVVAFDNDKKLSMAVRELATDKYFFPNGHICIKKGTKYMIVNFINIY